MSFRKPFIIVGIGKSGSSAAAFLQAAGIATSEIFTFDEKSEAQLNSWSQIAEKTAGTLVVSPGVPLQSDHIRGLVQKGWQITSEISLAATILTTEKLIGVTGSVGKSTVTSLIGVAAKNEDPQAFVGGNLGIPFCEYAINVVRGAPRAKWIVLELSSYQLENCTGLSLEYSAITFLSANHLERYATKDDYYMTKCRIGEMTKKLCVMNASSEDVVKYQSKVKGSTILVQAKNTFYKDISQIALIGPHNHDNFAVAAEIAQAAGWSEKSLLKMSQFSGLAHRLETIGRFNNVVYINDSKATAMDSVLVAAYAALGTIRNENRVFLLLGGKDKNLPWEQLAVLNEIPNCTQIFFGACGELAKQKVNSSGLYFSKLSQAVEHCFQTAQSGDVVLLSPGGTSLDEFKNFEDRGDSFRRQVLTHYK